MNQEIQREFQLVWTELHIWILIDRYLVGWNRFLAQDQSYCTEWVLLWSRSAKELLNCFEQTTQRYAQLLLFRDNMTSASQRWRTTLHSGNRKSTGSSAGETGEVEVSSTVESQEGSEKSITIVAGEIFCLDPGGLEGLMIAISSRPAETKRN